MSFEVSSLRALAHPIRLRILSLLTGAQLSATEIARELGITQANASYHVRTLAAAGYLQEVGEETIRGGTAKRYAYVDQRERSSTRAPDPEGQVLVFRAMGDELVRRAQHQATDVPVSITDAELWVDPDVWRRAVDLAAEASALLHECARPPRTSGTLHVNATIALFGMADAPEPEPDTEPVAPEPEEPAGTDDDRKERS